MRSLHIMIWFISILSIFVCTAALLGTFNQNSHLPQTQCFRSACADPSNIWSLSLTERSDGSVGILHQHFCEPILRGGIRATFLPDDDDDNAAGAAEAAETRGCRDGVPGMARGPTCAGPGSAAPLGTWMHISANSAEPHISGSAHSGSGGRCRNNLNNWQ